MIVADAISQRRYSRKSHELLTEGSWWAIYLDFCCVRSYVEECSWRECVWERVVRRPNFASRMQR